MNLDQLKELFSKIPVSILFLAMLAYYGWDYYSFHNDPESPLQMKTIEVATVVDENQRLEGNLKRLEAFRSQMAVKRAEFVLLHQKLNEFKTTLDETFDSPAFLRTADTEAKKTGLSVEKITPLGQPENKEYYTEHTFEFGFKGVYVQLLVFLHRLSQIQTLVRVESFMIRPTGKRMSGYTQLEGIVKIKGYNYLRSKADDLQAGGAGKAGGGS